MEDVGGIQNDGRVQYRSIELSGESPETLARETDTVPSVNQIEVHPYFTNDGVRQYGEQHGIVTEAWSPIAQGAVLGRPGGERDRERNR